MITQAQGVPNIKTDGSAVMTVYSKKWNAKYWQTGILPHITSSAYFSTLQKGDEVDVTTEPTVTFREYQNGQALVVERINLAKTLLKIDQAGYFNVALTDVDAELSHLDLGNKYQEVGQKYGQAYIDAAFFAAMVDEAHAKNKGATAGVKSGKYDFGTSGAGYGLNSSNIVWFVTSMVAALAEQHANEGPLWAVIPTWMQFLMVNSELKNAMIMGDAKSALRTGFIGTLWGMQFFTNTYLSGAGDTAATPTAVLAGNKDAVEFTLRMTETKRWDNGNFEKLIQGLMVWGWKCVKPEGLINAYVYMKAEA